ncbi:hypothetical protein EDL99_04715 [Ornithobacterium rhinotracheale]|uniref:hypothetical protein n=1 Tax=Ornithobacterium rhinotracheale TaxID=28251 RepID=UPI00129C61D2|nr:hypothetical protein [Ornithobacterium rhinotracheale]MRJ08188.1 hypothetical protein [Ornithobacterium rhinotracheale]UOH77386.1 hypothetical protein MT996_09220 [Ornithobacterium rhinotracheale]
MKFGLKIIIALIFGLALHFFWSQSVRISPEKWAEFQFFWATLFVPFQMGLMIVLNKKSDFVGFYFMGALLVVIIFAKIMIEYFFNLSEFSTLQQNILISSFFLYLLAIVVFISQKLNAEKFNRKKD